MSAKTARLKWSDNNADMNAYVAERIAWIPANDEKNKLPKNELVVYELGLRAGWCQAISRLEQRGLLEMDHSA